MALFGSKELSSASTIEIIKSPVEIMDSTGDVFQKNWLRSIEDKIQDRLLDNYCDNSGNMKVQAEKISFDDIKDLVEHSPIEKAIVSMSTLGSFKTLAIISDVIKNPGDYKDINLEDYIDDEGNIDFIGLIEKIFDVHLYSEIYQCVSENYVTFTGLEGIPGRAFRKNETINEICNTVGDVIKAKTYLEIKLLVGVLHCVDNASSFVIASIAKLTGHEETGKKIYENQWSQKISEEVDRYYDVDDNLKAIGDCAEKFGNMATYIALGILSVGAIGTLEVPACIALGATAFLAADKAGEVTRRSIDRTGEFGNKEFFYGVSAGLLTILTKMSINVITPALAGLGTEVGTTVYNATNQVIAKKFCEYIAAGVSGATVAGIYTLGEQGLKEFQDQLGWDVDDNADWNQMKKTIAAGAVSGVAFKCITDLTTEKVEEISDLTTEERIEEMISTPEGIQELIEQHPEKAELWESQLEALEIMNDPNASPTEIRSAQAKLSILKGQLLETATKDALSDAGLDVELQQRVVEGESGGTRPDVIAKNNTNNPIEVVEMTIQPDETISIECKCGGSAYMTNQLNNHIPNQLSGQEGTKVLLTTSDIKYTESGLAEAVCDKYGAKLVVIDVSVSDVERAIKEVAAI